MALVAEQTDLHRTTQINWLQLILIKTCQDYFRPSINRASDKKSKQGIDKIYNEFSDVLSIGSFEGTFSVQLKDGS